MKTKIAVKLAFFCFMISNALAHSLPCYVAIGASITSGGGGQIGLSKYIWHSPITLISKMFSYEDIPLKMVNLGISGATSKRSLLKLRDIGESCHKFPSLIIGIDLFYHDAAKKFHKIERELELLYERFAVLAQIAENHSNLEFMIGETGDKEFDQILTHYFSGLAAEDAERFHFYSTSNAIQEMQKKVDLSHPRKFLTPEELIPLYQGFLNTKNVSINRPNSFTLRDGLHPNFNGALFLARKIYSILEQDFQAVPQRREPFPIETILQDKQYWFNPLANQ